MFLNDLVVRLVAQVSSPMLIYGTNLGITLQYSIKKCATGAPVVRLVATSGSGAEHMHNKTTGPAFTRPTALVEIHAATSDEAMALAVQCHAALFVRNTVINTITYKTLTPLQDPYDAGTDAVGNAQWNFNVTSERKG